MIELQKIGLFVSFFMSLFLFLYAYIEAIKISNAEDKVYGGTFIFSIVMAFIFSGFTYTFI